MKQIFIIVLTLCVVQVMAQSHSEKIIKEFSFEKKSQDNALMIANIDGGIIVEAYNGDKILVEVTKNISAKTEARLEKGKQEIQLGVIDRADTIILYVDGLCSQFGRNTKRGRNWGTSWNYQWDDCGKNDCRKEYDYSMSFKVRIPENIHLHVSTVNNGDIEVKNSRGSVIAHNVNGSIKLINLERESEARTVNGNVDIEYAINPNEDCRFYTLNGDINAWFKKGLAANLSFESFNGSFYTNIDKLEPLPVQVVKKNSGEGVKYKVNGNRFKVGAGGSQLDFETFNGDVYLKERE